MKNLLFAIFMLAMGYTLQAQSAMFDRRIMQNGTNDTIELSTGELVIVATSSDDAEQEQDAMDALNDDDLDIGWEGEPEKLFIVTAGLRFQNITIPAGAIIDSAFVEFCSHEGKSAEDVAKINITAEATDNAVTFDLDNLITARPKTTASVRWEVAEEWDLWAFYRTPDIKDIIQEVVDRDGWSLGNALALIFQGEDQGPSDLENAREVEGFENIADPEDGGDGVNHPERIPRLVIYYTAPTFVLERRIVQNGANDTIELSTGELIIVNTSSDDAEQEHDAMDALTDDDLDMGWEGEPEKLFIVTAGLRFQNITIPQNATIDSAYLRFCSHEGKTAEDVANLTIVGEASDNAATYDLENLITARPQTTASVEWTVAEEWGLWEFYRSPDIAPVVQEIVNRAGWYSGNSMAFTMLGEDQGPSDLENAREVEAFENIADPEDGGDGVNHPERVPQLLIYYRTNTGITESIESKPAFIISPNPATNGIVNIRLVQDEASVVSVYNQLGALVLTQVIENGPVSSIHVNGLSKGLYLITLKQGNTVSSQKLILE